MMFLEVFSKLRARLNLRLKGKGVELFSDFGELYNGYKKLETVALWEKYAKCSASCKALDAVSLIITVWGVLVSANLSLLQLVVNELLTSDIVIKLDFIQDALEYLLLHPLLMLIISISILTYIKYKMYLKIEAINVILLARNNG